MVDTVKLGLAAPLSGLVEMYGDEISRAGKIACDEINENGGVLGRPLELIIEDDGSLPESSVSAATRLIQEHKCIAIIGNLLSNSRIAVAYRVSEPLKVPYLNFSFYEGSILSRYFFHFAALPNQQIDQMIPYMRNHYGPRMFFAGNNYEWPRGSIDAAKKALINADGIIAGEEYYPIGVSDDDIETLLNNVSRENPDVFVPYFAGEDQIKLLTRFTERGLKNKMTVVMGHYDEVMASLLPADVREGFYSSNTYFMDVESHDNQQYLKRLKHYPGVKGIWPEGNGILTNFGEGTYLCVKAFAKAANQAGSLNTDDLISALENIRLHSPQGEVIMDSVTHHAQVNTYLSLCQKNGTFKIIEAFGAMPPVIPERYHHQRISHQATMEEDIRLQARILEQMDEAVFLINTDDNTIIYTNEGAERLFRYNHRELIGKPVSSLIAKRHTHDQSLTDQIIRELKQTGQLQGEIQTTRKNKELFWCSLRSNTFTHPLYGEVWLAVFQDITELKNMQQELEQHRNQLQFSYEKLSRDAEERRLMESELRQAHKMEAIGTLAGGIAHDFNNILAAILGYTELAAEESKNNSLVQQHLAQVIKASNRARDLIKHILSFSRKEAYRKTQVRPDRIIDEAFTLLRASIPSSIQFNFNIEPHCGFISADPTQIHQVLMNICTNASQAMEDEGGMLDVSLKRMVVSESNPVEDLPEGEYVCLKIKDTGTGIPEDIKDRIFDPYFTTKDVGQGSGMGLAVVHGIVRSLDGHISVKSTLNVGSIFTLYFPVSSDIPDATTTSNAAAHTGKARILVVDDENEIAELIKVRLETLGYSVLAVNKSLKAYEIFCRNPDDFDLVISDQTMPDITGLKLSRQILSLRPKIPVIICTGYTDKYDIATIRSSGVYAIMQKPIDFNQLSQHIQQALAEVNNPHDETSTLNSPVDGNTTNTSDS